MPEKNYGRVSMRDGNHCIACWRNRMMHGNPECKKYIKLHPEVAFGVIHPPVDYKSRFDRFCLFFPISTVQKAEEYMSVHDLTNEEAKQHHGKLLTEIIDDEDFKIYRIDIVLTVIRHYHFTTKEAIQAMRKSKCLYAHHRGTYSTLLDAIEEMRA